jgi:succinate-semialdehyde dehydrogenase/glutarate-semialdehyde dehydrogenase
MYALAMFLIRTRKNTHSWQLEKWGSDWAISQRLKNVLLCRYYAENAATLLADEDKTEATKSYITFQPIGVILVMPWNFPFYQVIRFAIPSLMGNTGVLKHASNVQGCAFAIEDAFIKAGFPRGVFMNLNVESVKTLIENKILPRSR